jgi:hypothetical protein
MSVKLPPPRNPQPCPVVPKVGDRLWKTLNNLWKTWAKVVETLWNPWGKIPRMIRIATAPN